MVIDDAWDKAHQAREWGIYPSEHLVRFVMRTYGMCDRARVRFLDMGCGAGASTRFLLDQGFGVTALDSSDAAMARLDDWASHRVFEGGIITVKADLERIEFAPVFDCLIDVCSLQHVREPLLVLGKATKWLKPGGKMFSIWASDGHDKGVAEAISGHCWRLNSADLDAHFAVFHQVHREISVYTDREKMIAHWLVTAKKHEI